MTQKRFVIYLASAPSCSGKSTLIENLAKRIPEVYTVAYDNLKWRLSGYDREKHIPIIKEIALGLFEVVCKNGLPIFLDVDFRDRTGYMKFHRIAKKYGYEVIPIQLTAPKKVLLNRFRERVKNSKKMGTKISITSEKLFLKNLSKKSFVPKGAVTFDTSKIKSEDIAKKIIEELI